MWPQLVWDLFVLLVSAVFTVHFALHTIRTARDFCNSWEIVIRPKGEEAQKVCGGGTKRPSSVRIQNH
jgi:hypothetical protein